MMESKKMGDRVLIWLGSIGPLGYLPASGTVTVALVGVPGYFLMNHWGWPLWARIAAVVVFSGASVWVHEVGDKLLGEKDSSKLVWDELVGYWIAVLPAAMFTWQIAVATFFLERFLDIAKIPPANVIEKRWPGGWGVVGDDVMAGLYTALILAAGMHFAPGLLGLPVTP